MTEEVGVGWPGGWWILGEPERHLGPDVLVPDIAGWRRTRMPSPPTTAYFPLSPDWVCEVLSPSTASLDRTRKLAACARERVSHAWLVDQVARTLDVLRIDAEHRVLAGTHAGDETACAKPFTGIELARPGRWID